MVGHGRAWQARHGVARLGKAWQGGVWLDMAGGERSGTAWFGKAKEDKQ